MTCNTCYISDIPTGVGGSKSLQLFVCETGEESRMKNREIKRGYTPTFKFSRYERSFYDYTQNAHHQRIGRNY